MSDRASKIRGFFKTGTYIENIDEVLYFEPKKMIGVDNINNQKLIEEGIKTIEDLSNLSTEDPPQITGILPKLLIKWIQTSQVIKKGVKEEFQEERKLLMLGLDNSGKTSLLQVIKKKFARDILPTRGVKREKLDFFGYPIISWDLGGQVQFRENWYFEKPELYFTDANLMIYVVDVQDEDRFEESAEYFEKILNILDDLNENIPILIVLHKSDPDIIYSEYWEENVNRIRTTFNEILKPHDFAQDYAITSIFQNESVIQMFSSALKQFSETSEIIEHVLEDFAQEVGALCISLISIEGLIFGSYTTSENNEVLLNNTALLLQTLQLFYQSRGLKPDQTITQSLESNQLHMIGERLFEYSHQKTPVYLWVLSEDLGVLKGKVKKIRTELLPLVQLFL